MYVYKYVRKSELLKFIQSDFYKKCENIPISPLRAISYLNNFNSNDNDVVILMKLHNSKLIAYRCLFYEILKVANQEIKFAWISGSWVHIEYRRQGHSLDLLQRAYDLTKGRLMFSNYAPESHKLYLKSNLFLPVSTLRGYKYFFYFNLAYLLPEKKHFFEKFSRLLKFLDTILNKILYAKNIIVKELSVHNKITINGYPDIKKNAFGRNKEFFDYLKKYPWVTTDKSKSTIKKKYFFSYIVENYRVVSYCIDNNNFFVYKIRDNKLTIIYLYANNCYYEDIAYFTLNFCRDNRIEYLISYFEPLNKYFNKKLLHYLVRKKQQTNFYATKELADIIKKYNIEIQHGDGDNIFT